MHRVYIITLGKSSNVWGSEMETREKSFNFALKV